MTYLQDLSCKIDGELQEPTHKLKLFLSELYLKLEINYYFLQLLCVEGA